MTSRGNTTGGINENIKKNISKIQNALSYSFKNPELLTQALTHSSASNGTLPNNERLEFLGDAIVGVSITEYLYRNLTDSGEGELTQLKSALVSGNSLAKKTRELNLASHAHFGRGMPSPKQLSNSVLANIFEAVVGAIFLDSSFEIAKNFVITQLKTDIEDLLATGIKNSKAELQELCLAQSSKLPRYRVVSSRGPDHRKTFCVEVNLGERVFPSATGRSKKEAEQNAAANALIQLRKEDSTGEKQ